MTTLPTHTVPQGEGRHQKPYAVAEADLNQYELRCSLMAILFILSDAFRFLVRAFLKLFVFVSLFFILQYSTVPLGTEFASIALIVRDHSFDYITWELSAIGTKAGQTLYGAAPFMDEHERSNYARKYLADLGRAEQLEAQVSAVYTDPSIKDPDTASADLRGQRDRLRADLSDRQPLAESILEGQIAAVLADLGFGVGGQIFPPVSMHFTQVPALLVVSPRDRIQLDVGINLSPTTVDEQVALEHQIDTQQNVSSLIVPLGGIALYPSMILETPSLPDALNTISHEWLHHYLLIFPLGYSYDFAGETRIINETTASYFGDEVGRLALQRYYPDLVPPPPAPARPNTATPSATPAPPSFDFSAEMNTTRVEVDSLLAAGKVDEAEKYMEQRREVFVQHGYLIRKLNQAFFAFYGGYQSPGYGAGGSDPIGPAVQAIRDLSPSVYDWVATMRGIITRDQLLQVRDALSAAQSSP